MLKIDRKSTSGACCYLGNSLVSYSSRKQSSVTLSTAEAEYIATLRDYGVHLENVPLFCDNNSAICIAKNPVQHSRTKYIDI
jgi:hypothetical protein